VEALGLPGFRCSGIAPGFSHLGISSCCCANRETSVESAESLPRLEPEKRKGCCV